MTAAQFLADTVNHYNSTNRSQLPDNQSGHDRYRNKYLPAHENTLGCAIGRHLSREAAAEFDKQGLSVHGIMRKESFKSMLPEWMQILPTDFLLQIQTLHDNADYWNETGLTNDGKEMLFYICRNFNLKNPIKK